MSITDDFEDKCREIGDHWCHEPAFERDDVLELLAHARSLEEMLRKHQWNGHTQIDMCPECGRFKGMGHANACALAKLIGE